MNSYHFACILLIYIKIGGVIVKQDILYTFAVKELIKGQKKKFYNPKRICRREHSLQLYSSLPC